MNLVLTILLAILLIVPAIGSAHPQTERYIPIGGSPGRDHIVSGEIVSVDGKYLLVGGKNIGMGQATSVWIDRTLQRLSSQLGEHSDCVPGRFVEIRYRETDGGYEAEWIKVRGSN